MVGGSSSLRLSEADCLVLFDLSVYLIDLAVSVGSASESAFTLQSVLTIRDSWLACQGNNM
jgi:hypothetical protein